MPQHLLDGFSDCTNFHGMPESGEYRFTKLQDTVANSLVFRFLQYVLYFWFNFIYLQLFLRMQVLQILAGLLNSSVICFCGFSSNFDLDLSWPVGFLLKCVAVLAQVDCFAFHLYYTNNLFIFVHVQQLVIGSFKKTYANAISCQVLMTNIWISTFKLLGEEKDGSSFWGVK